MRYSSLTRAVDRTAAACSLQTGWRTGRPGSPVSCTKIPTFRNPYNGLLLILPTPEGWQAELALLVD